jgi:hypothetical protein
MSLFAKPSETKPAGFAGYAGELLILEPTEYTPDAPTAFPNPDGSPSDRITVNVTVVDVANPANSHTDHGVYVSAGRVIQALKPLVEKQGKLLTRLTKGEGQMGKYSLNDPSASDARAAELAWDALQKRDGTLEPADAGEPPL